MRNHQRNALFIFIILSLMLTQFQNCAPAQSGLIPASEEVRIVDRWSPAKLQFFASSYFVGQNVDSVNIEGLCQADVVDWEITKVHEGGQIELIDSGRADCDSGRFVVAVSSASEHLQSCAEVVEVAASLANEDGSAKTSLRVQCF